MVSYEPLPAKAVKQKQVRLSNKLLLRNTTDQITGAEGSNITLKLKNDTLMGKQTDYVVLRVVFGSEDLTLAISNDDLLEWVNPRFYVTDFSALPKDIVLFIYKEALSALWQWFQHAYSESPVLDFWELKKGDAFSDEEKSLSLNLSFPQTDADSTKRLLACFLINASFEQKEKLINSFPLSKPEENWAFFLWPVQISMGYSWLRMSQIIRIQQGDIIFFQHTPGEECLFARITSSQLLICKMVETDRLIVTQEERALMNDDDDLIDNESDGLTDQELVGDDFMGSLAGDEDKEAASDDTQTSKEETIDDADVEDSFNDNDLPPVAAKKLKPEIKINTKDIPVLLSFDVGSTMLSLGELQSVRKGYCFELINDFDDYITLRAHGQIIARGELVKIGDHLGVEVTKLGPQMKQQK